MNFSPVQPIGLGTNKQKRKSSVLQAATLKPFAAADDDETQ
jgi:hypothetical protein